MPPAPAPLPPPPPPPPATPTPTACRSMDPKFLRNQRYAQKHNKVAEKK